VSENLVRRLRQHMQVRRPLKLIVCSSKYVHQIPKDKIRVAVFVAKGGLPNAYHDRISSQSEVHQCRFVCKMRYPAPTLKII